MVLQLLNSTDSMVVLNDVDFATSGIYRCEVSAEAPSFQTVSDHGEIIVVGKLLHANRVILGAQLLDRCDVDVDVDGDDGTKLIKEIGFPPLKCLDPRKMRLFLSV